MVFESMFISLNQVVDRLVNIEERRITQRKQMFEKIFEPSFNDLQVVHTHYLTIFSKSAVRMDNLRLTSDSAMRLVLAKLVLSDIEELRPKFYPERDKLRAFVNILLIEKFPPEERTVVAAFRTYFETLFAPFGPADELEMAPPRVKTKLRAITTRMYAKVEEGDISPRAGAGYSREMRDISRTLEDTWSRTCSDFAKLKVKVVSLH
jgi:hypothetical protein